jgi:hypothetical protein
VNSSSSIICSWMTTFICRFPFSTNFKFKCILVYSKLLRRNICKILEFSIILLEYVHLAKFHLVSCCFQTKLHYVSMDFDPLQKQWIFLFPLFPDWLWNPPNLLPNRHRGSFPRGKARPEDDADQSAPSSAEVKNE